MDCWIGFTSLAGLSQILSNLLCCNSMIGILGSKLPVEPEHTGVDVNVGDLKDETLKCHIER